MDTLLKAANSRSARVLNVVDLSANQPSATGGLNEHVWYDSPTVRKLAARIVAALSADDSAHARVYRRNGRVFETTADAPASQRRRAAGTRWPPVGFGRPGRVPWRRIDEVLAEVGAQRLADMPISVLSGGEQQRIRIAQALV